MGTSERRGFTFKSDYETRKITVFFLIFLTTETGNSVRLSMHMIKVGGKLGGVTPAPWVLPVTDLKEDVFKW